LEKTQMAKFEAGVYNKIVRALMVDDEQHEYLEDAWADINYLEVRGRDEEEAMSRLRRRYPESQGFVITEIVKID
jgi:hypothetical protein